MQGSPVQQHRPDVSVRSPSRLVVILVALLLAASVPTVAHLEFCPRYQSNDDPGIAMLARGVGISPSPTPHIVYSNYLYGQILVSLYAITTAINWYYLLACGIHLAASMGLGYLLLRRSFRATTALLFLLYLFTFDLYYWIHPQFTVTAFLAAQTGVLIYWTGYRDTDRVLGRHAVGAAIFLFLGTLIRAQCVQLALFLFVPLGVAVLLRHPSRLHLKRLMALPVLGAGIVAGLGAYNDWNFARKDGWKDFYAFNQVRAQFHDYGHIRYDESTRPVFEQVGWSQTDYHMLMNWFFADRERYARANLETVASAFPPAETRRSVPEVMDQLTELTKHPVCQLMLAGALLFILVTPISGRTLLVYVFLVLGTLAVMGYLAMYLKLPERVAYPLITFVAAVALVEAVFAARQRTLTRFSPLLALVPLWHFVSTVPVVLEAHRDHQRFAQERRQQIETSLEQMATTPNRLILIWAGGFPSEDLAPGDNWQRFENINMLGLGCFLQTPITEERCREFGITDLYAATFERDDVYLLCNPDCLPLLADYIREHYGTVVRGELAENYPLFNLYRMSPVVPVETPEPLLPTTPLGS